MDNPTPELKAAERSALIAMATSGGALHETTDLRQRFGITFTRALRQHLIDRGLIRSKKKSAKSLELTNAGWTWAEAELKAEKPSGTMGLGAFYGVLHNLGGALDERGETLRSFFGRERSEVAPAAMADGKSKATGGAQASSDSYEDRIAEAAWAEADGAIATAMQDMPSFAYALERLRSLPAEARLAQTDKLLRQIELSAEQVFQSIRRAGARRDLTVTHKRGETVAFDATAYDASVPTNQDDKVVVAKPAIVRNGEGSSQVVVRGLVNPC